MTATGYANDDVVTEVNDETGQVTLDAADIGAAPALLMTPEPGKRWFLTDDPFNGTFTGQLSAGDRFSYPTGHASERETYRWSGATWVFEQVLAAIPAAASVAVTAPTHTHAPGAWSEPVYGTNVAAATTVSANAVTGTPYTAGSRLEATGGVVRLRGALGFSAIIAAGSTLATLVAEHRPANIVTFDARMSSDTSTRGVITPAGVIAIANATVNGGYLPMDGITFTVAAS